MVEFSPRASVNIPRHSCSKARSVDATFDGRCVHKVEDLEFFPTEHDAVSAPCENSDPKAAVERLPK
jgi:hypothetical protein